MGWAAYALSLSTPLTPNSLDPETFGCSVVSLTIPLLELESVPEDTRGEVFPFSQMSRSVFPTLGRG